MKIYYIQFILRISKIYSEKHQNVKFEDLLAGIDNHNASAHDALKHYKGMNHSSLFIHIHCGANDLYPIQSSIVNYILDIFYAKSKFPPIDVFALKYNEERINLQKYILFDLMQIYCRLYFASNHEEIKIYESSNLFFVNLSRKFKKVREILKSIKLYNMPNFLILNNCCVSYDDFMIFYRIISDLNVLKNFYKNSIHILFALKLEDEIQEKKKKS